jgi:hypothetical protein
MGRGIPHRHECAERMSQNVNLLDTEPPADSVEIGDVVIEIESAIVGRSG